MPRTKPALPCLALILAAALVLARPALADPRLCETAATEAAAHSGVPAAVMLAITLTETGRRIDGQMRPWPWTANAEGQGHWFDTRQQALDHARALLARGQTLFDLGCFQINWRWHGTHFLGPEDLLDPRLAAGYAARLLRSLHDETGSWEGAAGAYHSRTPEHAARYRARFAEILASLGPVPETPASVRVNGFPLLAAGASSGPSLVPASLPALAPLFAVTP